MHTAPPLLLVLLMNVVLDAGRHYTTRIADLTVTHAVPWVLTNALLLYLLGLLLCLLWVRRGPRDLYVDLIHLPETLKLTDRSA